MSKFNGIHIYELDDFYRRHLFEIEKDRVEKTLNEEDYFRERFKKFDINTSIPKKNARSKDDGIDLMFKHKEYIYICQLKYWNKPLNKKEIKEVFGKMYLSDIAIKYRTKGAAIKYFLICPFINKSCKSNVSSYMMDNYYIIYGKKFVEIILNPLYFIDCKKYEKED